MQPFIVNLSICIVPYFGRIPTWLIIELDIRYFDRTAYIIGGFIYAAVFFYQFFTCPKLVVAIDKHVFIIVCQKKSNRGIFRNVSLFAISCIDNIKS